MTHEEYVKRIQAIDTTNLDGWEKLAKDLRDRGIEFRLVDPKMTFIMQGLATQIDRYLDHVKSRQTVIGREIQIKLNAEPIDSEPDLTV